MKWIVSLLISMLPVISSSAEDVNREMFKMHKSVFQSAEHTEAKETPRHLKIALLSSPKVIGRYSQSTYSVAMATLLASNKEFELIAYDISDESKASLATAMRSIEESDINGVLAPLTLEGAKNLLSLSPSTIVFIPTVHKRDIGSAADNIVFGAIDYQAQIEALVPFMANSLAIFYGDSALGASLSTLTQNVASESNKHIKNFAAYSVDVPGSNIVKYMAKPALFSKKSIITHLPVVKTAMLSAQMTFAGAREHNILSTQINYDPNLLTLTQSQDIKNMIIANSIIDQVPSIYESNALMNNDLSFDWINYATSVGADYIIAHLFRCDRSYPMRIIESQVIYPIELMRPKEFGFEPYAVK